MHGIMSLVLPWLKHLVAAVVQEEAVKLGVKALDRLVIRRALMWWRSRR